MVLENIWTGIKVWTQNKHKSKTQNKLESNQGGGGGWGVDWLVLEHLLSAMSMRKNHPHQRNLLLHEKIDYPIHHTNQLSTQKWVWL
jgi:hypothetical protein